MKSLPSQHKDPQKLLGLNPNVFFLGLVSFLTDVSSEMIFTIVPLFLSNVLGAATTVIGLVGGISESTDAVFRILSGRISDKVKRRKLLAALGYGVSTLAKPFMYIASSWGLVAAVRFSDRVGKGIRSSPRDALLADCLAAHERGRGFGLHRAMDSAGAVTGLLAAAAIIYFVQGGRLELGLGAYQWIVLIGIIPAVVAVMLLMALVREARGVSQRDGLGALPADPHAAFDSRFKLFLVVMALFSLGNSSDFFVILRAQDLGASALYIVLMLVVLNVTYAAMSVPAGMLSDRLGRRRVIIYGWLMYAVVYLGFALASAAWHVWLLFASYGVYYGITEGVARAFVADLVPAERRGTAYGLYHGTVGLTLLPASVIAGWLWETVSPAAPFYFGAGLAFLGMVGISLLVRK
ncbi:MAG: MFS transporter [Chloroflexi bacterium]|nr:MFS transporter [Chloroflexota bacterium]